ncbi:Cytosolic Fe-S cluster assembly factor nar1 [Lambiella insularis]|nr:Cytosolic Fe-S cluster assembly factor nar1 [Lambiella insularis]
MSAILSADDLNDFISPGVACIKPVETLPLQKTTENSVTTEDKLPAEPPPPAQITLTDCLACSGCVTSAEAVLISLQSHSEVLHALDSAPCIEPERLQAFESSGAEKGLTNGHNHSQESGKVFVASVSPQVRASLAATYGTSEQEAGWMIDQLLSGPQGLKSGGRHGNGFHWVLDTNAMREVALVLGAEEVPSSLAAAPEAVASDAEGAAATQLKKPILTSACPGWICYAEKTHPHILPHLSRLKSPQALTGTLVKSVLSRTLHIDPSRIWHLAIMPCFDKKLEASREELTDAYWRPASTLASAPHVRDVDCVITARELLMLAETRGISFPSLPRHPLDPVSKSPFPNPTFDSFLFPTSTSLSRRRHPQRPLAGSSGGYLHHILLTQQSLHPHSSILTTRGRNADVVDYTLVHHPTGAPLFRAARFYGFRNIQNLVRKLKPARQSRLPGGKGGGARKPAGAERGVEYAYVEVMACPGGCTNGGGQIKVEDVGALQGVRGAEGQREWLGRVDEAYYSMEEEGGEEEGGEEEGGEEEGGEKESSNDEDVPMEDVDDGDMINGISTTYIKAILAYWADLTNADLQKLVYTSYRAVDSDVGKERGRETERVAELAGKIGGGW